LCKYITGKRCDRPAKDPNDACASNPCWGDSICIVLDSEARSFKCLCTIYRRGKYCQLRVNSQPSDTVMDYYSEYSSEFVDATATSSSPSSSSASSTTLPTSSSSQLSKNLNEEALSNLKIYLFNSINRTISENSDRSKSDNFYHYLAVNTTKPSLMPQRNVTTRGLYNTFIPKSEYQGMCNYNTCQLGKCLTNGTCECVKPAVGKFCDQIDECLVLKCINVSHSVKLKFCLKTIQTLLII
jgi:hypothetical protein